MGGGPSVINKPITIDRLFQCVAKGKLDLFKESYEIVIKLDGKDRVINYKDENLHNRNSLMICCIQGYTEIVELLINANASLNEIDDDGHTALMLAADKNYNEIVELLLTAGANANIQTNSGQTALIIATNNNHVKVVKLLVDANADLTLCTKGTFKGGSNTAFVIAIWNGFLECAKLLYKEEFLNIKDNNDKYPLMHACQNGHDDIVKWLKKIGCNLNSTNDLGYSAIFFASQLGKVGCIEILLKGKAKANVNLRNNYGNTCIYKAIENGHLKVIQALVNGGADINHKNNNGITPLMQAAWSGKLDCMKYLIDRKAELNDKDNKGETALMKSSFKNNLVCLKVLISSGASVSIKDNVGMLAIHHSCISGAKNTLKELIDKSIITIDEKDNEGHTPMMIAAMNGHSKTILILIENRSLLNSVNKKQESALILASKLGRSEAVKVLLNAGADPLKVNVDGLDALSIAHSKKEKVRDALLSTISTLRIEGKDAIEENNDNDDNNINNVSNNDSFDAFDNTIDETIMINTNTNEDYDKLNEDEEKMNTNE